MSSTMTASAQAHSNIALVKYWGKRDLALNLPAEGSLSVTLGGMTTTTTVTFRDDAESDVLILDGHATHGRPLERIQTFLNLVRRKRDWISPPR